MTLQQLISGKYCPFTGIEVKYLNALSNSKMADRPPGYYYCLDDRDRSGEVDKKDLPAASKPYIQPPKKKRKEPNRNRSEYWRQWYAQHKEHKHQMYLQRKMKSVISNS